MSHGTEIEANFIDELLALPTRERRADSLRSHSLLDPEGLERLLDSADNFLGSDPGKARLLAELCESLAEDADAPAAAPRANYMLVQIHYINGEFEESLRLVEIARNGYRALGMNYEALRVNVGNMAALLELGRYQKALDSGQKVLDALEPVLQGSGCPRQPSQDEPDRRDFH